MSEDLAILHLLDKNRLITGSVVQMVDAAGGMAARGHRVAIAGRAGGDLEAASVSLGIEYLPMRLAGSLDLSSVAELRRRIRRRPVDIIHVHKGGALSVALAAVTGLGRRPVVVANRGVSFPLDVFNRWKYRHPRVRSVVCVAEAVRGTVIAGGVPPERVDVVRSGTDVDRFDPERVDPGPVRRELGLQDELLVGLVSMRDWKGWRESMAAFAAVNGSHPRSRVLIVGCESDNDRLRAESAAAAQGVRDALRTMTYRRDIERVLAACDVVVDSSWEGTGITGTIREAMALERAVVASECGGNSELVVDGESGLLVPPRNIAAAAAALNRLLGEPELRRRMGLRARERVLAGFTTEQRLDRLEEVYRRALGLWGFGA